MFSTKQFNQLTFAKTLIWNLTILISGFIALISIADIREVLCSLYPRLSAKEKWDKNRKKKFIFIENSDIGSLVSFPAYRFPSEAEEEQQMKRSFCF